ncbi:hypothetical protein [Streptomyces sp. NPDC002067]
MDWTQISPLAPRYRSNYMSNNQRLCRLHRSARVGHLRSLAGRAQDAWTEVLVSRALRRGLQPLRAALQTGRRVKNPAEYLTLPHDCACLPATADQEKTS